MYTAVWIYAASAFRCMLRVMTHYQLSNPRLHVLFRATVYLLRVNDIRFQVPKGKDMVVSLNPSDPSLQ